MLIGTYCLDLQVEVKDKQQLEAIIKSIQRLDGVVDVDVVDEDLTNDADSDEVS